MIGLLSSLSTWLLRARGLVAKALSQRLPDPFDMVGNDGASASFCRLN